MKYSQSPGSGVSAASSDCAPGPSIGVGGKPSRKYELYGVSVLTGIGFTMSLFIASLAFEDDGIFQYTDKLAILIGSFMSAIIGYLVLKAGKQTPHQGSE